MLRIIFLILIFFSNILILPSDISERDIIYQDNSRVNLLDFSNDSFLHEYFDQLFLSELENNRFTNLSFQLNNELVDNVESLSVEFDGLSGIYSISDTEVTSDFVVINLKNINNQPFNDQNNYLLNIELIPIEGSSMLFQFDFLSTNPNPFIIEEEIMINKISNTSVEIEFRVYDNSSLSNLLVSLNNYELSQDVEIQSSQHYSYKITFEDLLSDKVYIPKIEFTWNNAYYGEQQRSILMPSFIIDEDGGSTGTDESNKNIIIILTIIINIISIVLLTILVIKILNKRKQTN